MIQLSKQRIIEGFNRRDPAAITCIYESYFGMVFRLVSQAIDGSPEAEDLAAEVFYKLIKYPGPFEKLKQIEYFLYKTAKNTCLDYLKHQQVEKNHFPQVERYHQELEERDKEAAEIRERFESLMELASAKLSPSCRQIIILGYAHGLGNPEIARRLGLSEKTVANRKTLAMKRLRLAMKTRGQNGLFNLFFL